MIEKLELEKVMDLKIDELVVLLTRKINELIDAHNDHFHHARELQFGTELPQYVFRGTHSER